MVECANFLAGRGHEVHVISAEWDKDVLDPPVVRHPVAVQGRSWMRVGGFARASRAALAAMQPAPEVHAAFGVHSPPDGVLWVQSVHKAWMEISRQQRNWRDRLKQRLNPFHKTILKYERAYYAGRLYRRLIALTDQVKHDLMRFYDVPADDIDVLPNGFSTAEFSPARRAERSLVRRSLGYGDRDRVVIFVANELERKGFAPLLRAIARLKDPSVHLLAVGRLDARAYAGEIERLGMSGAVKFTGPSSDVGRFYTAADVFALPTQYEAWGLVIVEAMASGLPVLTSRLAGAAVAVEEGRTGLLLDDPANVGEIQDKLASLLHGVPASPEQISQSVQAYAWPVLLGRYEQLLLEAAGQGRPAGVLAGA